jgi:hypothetical protein
VSGFCEAENESPFVLKRLTPSFFLKPAFNTRSSDHFYFTYISSLSSIRYIFLRSHSGEKAKTLLHRSNLWGSFSKPASWFRSAQNAANRTSDSFLVTRLPRNRPERFISFMIISRQNVLFFYLRLQDTQLIHPALFVLIIWVTLGKRYKLWSSTLSDKFQSLSYFFLVSEVSLFFSTRSMCIAPFG